jgi:hypothetical protein
MQYANIEIWSALDSHYSKYFVRWNSEGYACELARLTQKTALPVDVATECCTACCSRSSEYSVTYAVQMVREALTSCNYTFAGDGLFNAYTLTVLFLIKNT